MKTRGRDENGAGRAKSAPGLAYQPGLDGVRALALLAVLAYHDGRLRGGFLGVSTFFTLSGFLITGLLLTERGRTGRISLREFYARRVRRLLPAALVGLLLAAVITPRLGDPALDHAFRGDALSALFDVANWRFLATGQSYGAQFSLPSTVLHFWSLAVEEQFYLVLVPVIVGVLWLLRSGRRRVLGAALATLAVASAVDGWLAAHHGEINRAYYGTDTRALEFLVGALLAVVLTSRPLGRRASRATAALGVPALAFLAVMATRARPGDAGLFRGGLLAYAAAGALLLVAVCEPGPLRWMCSRSPLRALGRISYGVYVFHWPLFLWLDPSRTGLSGWSLTALRCGVTFALATASYVLLEQPVRTGRWSWGRKPWTALAAGSLAVVVAGVTVGATAPALAIDFAPVQKPIAVLAAGTRVPATSPHPAPSATAARPAAPPLRRIMVVGDSVALTLGRGIERWGAKHGITVLNAGSLGCTMMDDNLARTYGGIGRRSPDSCRTTETWPTVLPTFRPDLVIALFGAWDTFDMSWDNGRTWSAAGQPVFDAHYLATMRDAATRLASDGARVLWLTPPCFGEHAGDNSTAQSPWYDPHRIVALAELLHTVARDTHESVSDVVQTAGCPVNYTPRPDGVHFSDAGADAMMPALGPAILRAAKR